MSNLGVNFMVGIILIFLFVIIWIMVVSNELLLWFFVFVMKWGMRYLIVVKLGECFS